MKHRARTSSPARRAYYDAASYRRWIAWQIGPRRVGGIYRGPYVSDTPYEVLAIDPGPREGWPAWQITVRTLGEDRIRQHCTAWDHGRDVVIDGPAAVTVWAHHTHAHHASTVAWLKSVRPAETAVCPLTVSTGAFREQLHLLDEIAHPDTIAAFQRLAHTAQIA
ncbi:hypothetical protein [Kitasatospora sp. HPMI-4]|uniref:hypothetical protein n=1 Tax=Kitasatospora sp. HPMI-4 TaxID=3448443 RepID=UPI003F199D5C